MASVSIRSPTSPLTHKDFRGDAQGHKRDRDHSAKWILGAHDSTTSTSLCFATDYQSAEKETTFKVKLRPNKPSTKTPKMLRNIVAKPFGHPGWTEGGYASRYSRRTHATLECEEATDATLSRSLLDLLPNHSNNTVSSIQVAAFDTRSTVPHVAGRSVDLGGLVDRAERKWTEEQTAKIVAGEYEVLDLAGESTRLNARVRGKRGSPKQKSSVPHASRLVDDEEDDFELI